MFWSSQHRNNLKIHLAAQLDLLNAAQPVWIEDESVLIGRCSIPNPLFHQMRDALITVLKVSPEARVNFLVNEYGRLDKDFLKACTEKIRKRLGPEQTKNAIAAIADDRMADFIRIVLVYYDKAYNNGLSKRKPGGITTIECIGSDAAANARLIIAGQNKLTVGQAAFEN